MGKLNRHFFSLLFSALAMTPFQSFGNEYAWMFNNCRTPGEAEKRINVNLYANNDPYDNSAWNNWNVGSGDLSSAIFNFSDGSPSGVSAVLSAQTGVADNGPDFTVTMCPQQVARFTSYYSGSGGRTLTLTGLDDSKTYRIDFYSTCDLADQTTTFTTGSTSVTIATGDDTSLEASFYHLKASGGTIVVRLTHSRWFDYLNGFAITEENTAVPANTDSTLTTAVAPAIAASPDTAFRLDRALSVHPNPTGGSFELDINNGFTGRMIVDIYSEGGMLVKEIVLAKTTTEMETPLSLYGLDPGNYVLVATIGNWRRSLQVQKF